VALSAKDLHVVTAISNPMRWKSRIALYKRFEEHMLDSGVELYVVECALGDRPFELDTNPHVNHIGVRHTTLYWNKENLLNIGISRLPGEAKYIATADADVIFRSPTWAKDSVEALQQYRVIQPWENCYDLGPVGEHLEFHTSFGSLVAKGKGLSPDGHNGYAPFSHPGFFWAWTRHALECVGGLIDFSGLGAADHMMAWGMLGRIDETYPTYVTEEFKAMARAWQSHAAFHLGRDHIGYVPGTIEHMFHGSKSNPAHGRRYLERWDIIKQFGYNPITDIKRNAFGVIELAGNKPGFEAGIDGYFRQRAEDSNQA
jgi:hypothetical protein